MGDRTASVGQAIDDEGPGKIQEFLKDPKNLAALLVFGAAVAQPRTGGRSVLAHAARAGVGAVGVRGGIERSLQDTAAEEQEAASVQQQRAANTGVAQDRNQILNRQVGVQEQAVEQRGEIAETRAAAESAAASKQAALDEQRNTIAMAGLFSDAMNRATQSHLDAVIAWNDPANTNRGPRPQLNAFVNREFAALEAAGVPVNAGFEPQPLPEPSPTETPTGDPTSQVIAPVEPNGIYIPRLTRNVRSIGTKPADEATSQIAKLFRTRVRGAFKDVDDATLLSQLQQINEITTQELELGMSGERAKEILADKLKVSAISEENYKKIKEIARDARRSERLSQPGGTR